MFAKYPVVDLSEVRCNYEIVVLTIGAVNNRSTGEGAYLFT